MNKTQQVKNETEVFGISTVCISTNEKPYVFHYDSRVDRELEGSYHLTVKELVKELQKEGLNSIRVYSDWNEYDEKAAEFYIKKAQKIAEQAGYISTVKLEDGKVKGFFKSVD
jgi:16S rRNA C1402 N4-methylase RsmH